MLVAVWTEWFRTCTASGEARQQLLQQVLQQGGAKLLVSVSHGSKPFRADFAPRFVCDDGFLGTDMSVVVVVATS